jgi:hypothetical protein
MKDMVFECGRLTAIEHAVKPTSKKNVSIVIEIHMRCEKVK